MDFYTFSLGLGVAGLGAMALGGMVRHGPGDARHGGGHAGGHGSADFHTHGHAHAAEPHAHASAARAQGAPLAGPSIWAGLVGLLSPRVVFGILLGMGTAGVVLHRHLGGGWLFLLALGVGLAFERLLLTPLGNLALRFASRPAPTLETAVCGEATAVTTFDGNGQGIVQIDLDGHLVQVLATLTTRDRALGHRVRPGETLRIEDVDPQRNCCSVTLL